MVSGAFAYLLVFHGSRDPRPWQAVQQLSHFVLARLQEPQDGRAPLVGTACLELGPAPLHQQVQQFAQEASRAGVSKIHVVPLFLLPGVHVKDDIPAELAIAQAHLPAVTLRLCPHLGSHPGLAHLLPVPSSEAAGVLLSHGSRRPQGNEPVEQRARQLNLVPAYWSVAPDLATQVQALVAQGYGQIKIIPYFLFAGGITDAIALQVAQLAQQKPGVTLHLADPFGPSPALADLVVDLATDLPRVPSPVTYDC